MNDSIHLAHYLLMAGRVVESGERINVDQRWHHGNLLCCYLVDPVTKRGAKSAIRAVVEADGERLVLLGSAAPDRFEDPVQTYVVTRAISADTFEIADEQLVKRLEEKLEMAIRSDANSDSAKIENILGPFLKEIPPACIDASYW